MRIVQVAIASVLILFAGCSGGSYESPTAPQDHCACTASGEVPPPCQTPAPLLEAPEYVPNSYIVDFYPNIDVVSTTQSFEQQYCFTPDYVFVDVPHGFSATLTPCAVAAIRCRVEVKSVSRNAIGHLFATGSRQ